MPSPLNHKFNHLTNNNTQIFNNINNHHPKFLNKTDIKRFNNRQLNQFNKHFHLNHKDYKIYMEMPQQIIQLVVNNY